MAGSVGVRRQNHQVTAHVFVDESKASGLLVCAAVALPERLGSTRRELRALLLKGQERLHFKHERPSHHGEILTRLQALDVAVRVYDAQGFRPREELAAREACLRALVADLAASRPQRLVLERDESPLRCTIGVVTAKSEPMLWVPDAVAWSWAKGGRWRAAVRQLVAEVREV